MKIKNKGITLIALVITIIVLLILAGISIATLMGDNGILTKANNAKENTQNAEESEKIRLAIIGATTGENGTLTRESLEKEIKTEFGSDAELGTIEGKEETGPWFYDGERKNYKIYKDGKMKEVGEQQEAGSEAEVPKGKEWDTEKITPIADGERNVIPVPKGFNYVEGTEDTGVVISDAEEAKDDLQNTAEGNQFVWVPVPNIDDFHYIEGYYNGSLQDLTNLSEPYKTDTYTTEETEYNAMKTSVEKNGGFYIGRYEAGNDGSNNVVVKKGVTVYNNIGWNASKENAMDDETGGAVEKAKGFTNGKSYEKNVTSTLVYGVQWDATMQFMDNNYKNGNCETNSYVRNSTKKGWYIDNYNNETGGNKEHKTGIDLTDENGNILNCVKNIYDMAGNVREWTMEFDNNGFRILRGGYFSNDGSNYPASFRTSNIPSYRSIWVGFRVALYL